jgi:hypothetical protein
LIVAIVAFALGLRAGRRAARRRSRRPVVLLETPIVLRQHHDLNTEEWWRG